MHPLFSSLSVYRVTTTLGLTCDFVGEGAAGRGSESYMWT
jgi:hypothetical protein